jgi:predicted small metal-binding protein
LASHYAVDGRCDHLYLCWKRFIRLRESNKVNDMAKYEFACKDIGMQCGFSAEAKTQDELMQKIAQHAKEAHNMTEIPPETLQKVKGAIKKKGWF